MRRGEIALDRHGVGLLKAGRNALHWSQEDLAKESGVSVATIKRIEKIEDRIDTTIGDTLRHLGIKNERKMSAKSKAVRREKIKAMLLALERNGVTIWGEGNVFGISIKCESVEQGIFDVAKKINQK